ncbi:MAG: hypothetical protein DDT18_01187 [Actinobacteria bacterium]|uniref:Uncharacterized protein n=1 Tax=Candidatus Hakubella thermalkaliphila TaxID=2754717 RepID=A0A6V8PFQ5_9ACTN|nr:hypothetical protein [Actinomycetota bacterium]GFP31088.1 hypothetical protein HKBW3S34_02007 [Candidatus Hakubella thermalkaliphila]
MASGSIVKREGKRGAVYAIVARMDAAIIRRLGKER